MPTITYSCPHCHRNNEVSEPSWDERFVEKLPSNLLKGAAVAAATVLTWPFGGVGGVVVGGALYGKAVAEYFEGKTLTCGYCRLQYTIVGGKPR